ncbi:hypothetical protein [Litorilituus lipolyticus]|uniref:Uncharacterized protein n=1 Tax=Litorilituus lipolyticus TaxID=2491017 RepID=A0A502KU00_9GAMM|nr:hypothetical protein [Litorilituus lipolyticus]TPH14604.1 hypothetical protein EPA86_10900 [Litorilituus lipolyticus]
MSWSVMKVIFSVLICFYLIGCSSSKVHLYSRYLSDSEIKKVSEEIEELGFDVVTNTLSFPEKINQSTLVYSPFLNDGKNLDSLVNLLSKLDWPISNIELLVNGNHWFKNDSIGLFLLHEGIKRNDTTPAQDLVNEYEVRGCDIPVKMKLYRDNTYQLFFANKPSDRTDYLEGIWKLRSYPYLELTSFNERWWFYFEIEQKTEIDKVSEIEIIELKPLDKYSFIPNCSFIYGQRS